MKPIKIFLGVASIYAVLWMQIYGAFLVLNFYCFQFDNCLNFFIFIHKLNKRFYKIECPNNTESEYAKNFVCKVSKNTNGTTTITAYFDLIRPLNYIGLNYILFHKTSNQIVLNATYEYCSSFGNAHPLVQFLLNSFKKFSKNFIHPCPYEPTLKMGMENWSFDANNISMPLIQQRKGDYKISFDCIDRRGKLIFYFHVHCLFTQRKAKKN